MYTCKSKFWHPFGWQKGYVRVEDRLDDWTSWCIRLVTRLLASLGVHSTTCSFIYDAGDSCSLFPRFGLMECELLHIRYQPSQTFGFPSILTSSYCQPRGVPKPLDSGCTKVEHPGYCANIMINLYQSISKY